MFCDVATNEAGLLSEVANKKLLQLLSAFELNLDAHVEATYTF